MCPANLIKYFMFNQLQFIFAKLSPVCIKRIAKASWFPLGSLYIYKVLGFFRRNID